METQILAPTEEAVALAARILREGGLVGLPTETVYGLGANALDEAAVRALCGMEPDRVVYVSCNPATLARDITVFNSNGYELKCAEAVDMFPRTSHVETVCLLCH